MRSRDCLQPVDMVELSSDLITKEPPSATGTDSPCINVLWITPHQVAKCAFVRNLLRASNDSDLVDGPDLGAETAVYTENSAVDNSGEHKEVEYLAASLPDRCIAVFCLALFVEAVHLGDLAGLVVATDKHYTVGVPNESARSAHTSVFLGKSRNQNTKKQKQKTARKVCLLCLQTHQQREGFQTEIPTIDKVAQEHKASIGRL